MVVRVSVSFSTHLHKSSLRCPSEWLVDGQNLPAEDGPRINVHLNVVRLVFEQL